MASKSIFYDDLGQSYDFNTFSDDEKYQMYSIWSERKDIEILQYFFGEDYIPHDSEIFDINFCKISLIEYINLIKDEIRVGMDFSVHPFIQSTENNLILAIECYYILNQRKRLYEDLKKIW